ncbi:protein SOSEKI 3-like isoform X1 [Zingiber officinale]|uniref:protein SOSEKI 3-like isoform X1 n=1 Tax=Zingiber officinale TaxID=94328 RepID=UPI001C4AFB9B|nr:protein SOSEKI 3-like isoform X1 [Zingiber officinale]XP_042375689.1 protein SOSEKI 3-like isoform X1 [Zingiber officinale]
MDARMRRYAPQVSPDRTRVWAEPPPKHHFHAQERQQGGKIPVVYYLCRNRHLEHPHFIEVPLCSPEGLYLKDVIERLNVLRGKGMAAMYSWSCKRGYKNGFVWHDLSEDDLILPAQGNEYVLKGSELMNQTPPERNNHGMGNAKIQNLKQPPQDPSPSSYKVQEASCSPSSVGLVTKDTKFPPPSPKYSSPPPAMQDAELFPSTHQLTSSGNFSPEPGGQSAPRSAVGSPNPDEYKICNPVVGSQDASTQTEGGDVQRIKNKLQNVSVSFSDGSPHNGYNESQNEQTLRFKLEPEIAIVGRSPATTISSDISSGRMNTLESLIRDEVNRRNNLSVLEGEEDFHLNGPKFKTTSMLMHLITCGSTTVKNHYGFGFAPTYRPRITNMNFTSPLSTNSLVMGEINCLAESQREIGKGLKLNESFGRSMNETKYNEEIGGLPHIKQSSSIDEDRILDMPYNSRRDGKKAVDLSESKFLLRTIKLATSKHSRNDQNESAVSPVLDTRMSPAMPAICKSSPLNSSNGGSKRIIESSSINGTSARLESFRNRTPCQETVIQIEERLTSGARVIIQSGSRSDNSEGSSD